jgi:OmpA-like transmembrane domain
MNIHRVVAALLLMQAATSTTLLAAEGFQISPRIGKTTLHLDADVPSSNQSVDKDTFLTGVTLGYVTPFYLLTEAGYSKQGNWDVFGTEDKYTLSEYTLAVGAQLDTPHGFRIIPKVGRARWDLYSKEGSFQHPGPELVNTIRSYDNFWELTVQKQLSNSIALGVTYKDNRYDFGTIKTIAFTASFGL